MKHVIGKRHVNGERTAMQKTEHDRGITWRRVVVADVAADVELLIDVDALLQHLGRRALHNRSGQTQLASGRIEVRIVRGTRKEVARAEA